MKKIILILHSIYCELVPSIFRYRRKIDSSLLILLLEKHQEWINSNKTSGKQLKIYSRNLKGFDFSKYKLNNAILRDCDLRTACFCSYKKEKTDEESSTENTYYSDLTQADLSYSKLELAVFATPEFLKQRSRERCIVTNTRFVGCTGLFGAEGAYLGYSLQFDPTKPPIFQRWLPGSTLGDFPSWNVLAIFQHLRLLALSNSLAIFLVLYASVCQWYNAQLERLQAKVAEIPVLDETSKFISQLYPLPIPEHFGRLLLVICILVLANILYSYSSPESTGSRLVIESYSANNESIFRSLSARYSRLVLRWICFSFITYCCIYLINYFTERVISAFEVYMP